MVMLARKAPLLPPGMDAGLQANGTCCCQWECSHWMQTKSKDLPVNLRARLQCVFGCYLDVRVESVDVQLVDPGDHEVLLLR